MRKRNVVAAVFAVTCITATGAIAARRTVRAASAAIAPRTQP